MFRSSIFIIIFFFRLYVIFLSKMQNILCYFSFNCDAPRPWGLYFQDTATPQMEGLIKLHNNITYTFSFPLDSIVTLVCFLTILLLPIIYMSIIMKIGYVLDQNDPNRPRSHSDWHWVTAPYGTIYRNSVGNNVTVTRESTFLFDSLDSTGTIITSCVPSWGTPATLRVGNVEYTGRLYGPSTALVIANQRPFIVRNVGIRAWRFAGVEFSSKGNPFPINPLNNIVYIHSH